MLVLLLLMTNSNRGYAYARQHQIRFEEAKRTTVAVFCSPALAKHNHLAPQIKTIDIFEKERAREGDRRRGVHCAPQAKLDPKEMKEKTTRIQIQNPHTTYEILLIRACARYASQIRKK